MTVPGVYSPEQVQSHVDKVIASDGVDDSRAVEVMARAIADEIGVTLPNDLSLVADGKGHQGRVVAAARAALGALRALEGE